MTSDEEGTAVDQQTGAPDEHPEVVVGVDGSELALHAVRWAAAEARLRGHALQILHAAPYASGSSALGRRRAHDILARGFTVARRSEPGLRVTTRCTEDAAGPTLLAAAERARLLVVGMGGGDRPLEALVGSTALDVCGRARCPVVVVRGRHRVRVDGRPVLLGVDLPVLEVAVTAAFSDARRHGTGLVVRHALHGTALLRDNLTGREAAEDAMAGTHLADVLEPWSTRYPDVPVDVEVIHGHPSSVLLGAAIHARLVVLGTRGRSAPARALFGSTSREVLRRSPAPVLVVSPGCTVTDDAPAVEVATATPALAPDDPHDPSQLW